MLTEIGLEDTLELLGILRALQQSCGPRKMVVGSYFGQYLGLSGIKDPRLLKSFVLVVWWSRLGSPQLYWTDYEPSCAQNMDHTTHTYIHTYIYIYIL